MNYASTWADAWTYPEPKILDATLHLMAKYARGRHGALHPTIRAWALYSVRACAPLEASCYGAALLGAMRRDTPYRHDPLAAEVVQTPVFTVSYHGGDCDDLTTLGAAAGLALGVRVAFLTGSKVRGGDPTHVLPCLWSGGGWYPFDPSIEGAQAGQVAHGFYAAELLEVEP